MRITLFFAAVLTLPALGFAANIVVNPGFENFLASPWVTNWDLALDPHTGFQSIGTGCTGAQCTLPGANASYLYQDLTTSNGTTYTLSFYLQVDGTGTSTPNDLRVFFNGAQVLALTNITALGYQQYSTTVVAGGTGARLEFLGRNDPSSSRIDDVSLDSAPAQNPVPEPATWLLFAAGFSALVTARLSYRRKATRTT